MIFFAPCSAGDLLDRVTILRIKFNRLSAEKAAMAGEELVLLEHEARELFALRKLVRPVQALAAINDQLWSIEEQVRAHHRANDFGEKFVETAKLVSIYNDKRAALKREINVISGSDLVEVKSHAGL